MSLTPRKAASLLGAAALSVTGLTGLGWAASSTALASVRPAISKLSPSQVKARSAGQQERMVVVFDDQLKNLRPTGPTGTPVPRWPSPCRRRS